MKTHTQLDPKILELVTALLRDLDSPMSSVVLQYVKEARWLELTELRFEPHQYTPEQWLIAKRDYQAIELLRKADFLPIPELDLEAKAEESFFVNERQCYETNCRLEPLHPNSIVYDDWAADARMFVRRVKKRIRRILGPVPDQIQPEFGPGSVFESSRVVPASELVLLDKLDRIRPHVTQSAEDIFQHYFHGSLWGKCTDQWATAVITTANRFGTVPKSATSLRAIGVEPGGNLWLQKGIGRYIRNRLQRIAGLLREEGKSEAYHHELAKRGSMSGEIATIDLSNASDTISKTVVRLCLPSDWRDLLESVRTPRTLIGGREVLLEKFSSMGNGFTFELETLLFFAITSEVVEGLKETGPVSVYGDDIICPVGAADEVIHALRFFGFTPNTRKTFVQGYFRESCGGDYFAGHDVTPFRLTKLPELPEDWIAICNKIHARWDREDPLDPAYHCWRVAYSQVPRNLRRCQSTTEYGDSAVHWKEPRLVWDRKLQSFRPYLLSRSPVRVPMYRHSPTAILCYALLGGDPEGPTPRIRSREPIHIGFSNNPGPVMHNTAPRTYVEPPMLYREKYARS